MLSWVCLARMRGREPRCSHAQGIQFSVVVTEGRPDETGLAMARELDELRVPVIAILDSGVAFALERERCAWRPLVLFDCAVAKLRCCCGLVVNMNR